MGAGQSRTRGRRRSVLAAASAIVAGAVTLTAAMMLQSSSQHPHSLPRPAGPASAVLAAARLAPASSTLVIAVPVPAGGWSTGTAWPLIASMSSTQDGLARFVPGRDVLAAGYAATPAQAGSVSSVGDITWLLTGSPAAALAEQGRLRSALASAPGAPAVSVAGPVVRVAGLGAGAKDLSGPRIVDPGAGQGPGLPSTLPEHVDVSGGLLLIRPLRWLTSFAQPGSPVPPYAQAYFSALSGGSSQVWLAGLNSSTASPDGPRSSWSGRWVGGTAVTAQVAQNATKALNPSLGATCSDNCVQLGQVSGQAEQMLNMSGAVLAQPATGRDGVEVDVYPGQVLAALRQTASQTRPGEVRIVLGPAQALTVNLT